MTHYWRLRYRLPTRYGTHCRMLARGGMNSVLIEFADGIKVVANRWAMHRLPAGPT